MVEIVLCFALWVLTKVQEMMILIAASLKVPRNGVNTFLLWCVVLFVLGLYWMLDNEGSILNVSKWSVNYGENGRLIWKHRPKGMLGKNVLQFLLHFLVVQHDVYSGNLILGL